MLAVNKSVSPIREWFIRLAIGGLISSLVVVSAQPGDLAGCARIREGAKRCEGKSGRIEVYVDNMNKNRMVRATIRKHSQEGDEDTDYAIAEGGQLFIGCGGGDTSFTVVGCQVLKREIKDER